MPTNILYFTLFPVAPKNFMTDHLSLNKVKNINFIHLKNKIPGYMWLKSEGKKGLKGKDCLTKITVFWLSGSQNLFIYFFVRNFQNGVAFGPRNWGILLTFESMTCHFHKHMLDSKTEESWREKFRESHIFPINTNFRLCTIDTSIHLLNWNT